jgi:hypothetical protein
MGYIQTSNENTEWSITDLEEIKEYLTHFTLSKADAICMTCSRSCNHLKTAGTKTQVPCLLV